jgi:ceramide glucosyltransferase
MNLLHMNLLQLIAAAGVVSSLAYYFAATWAALRFARDAEKPPGPLPKIPPKVAVFKPLDGMSQGLPENIVSYLELDYPRTEYIFGVSSYEDRAIDVPVGLRAPYQFATIAVTVGEEPGCANHKVAKLIRMAERASDKAEIFLLSDADVSVDREHLKRVVGELIADEKVGVVTCLYRGRPRETLAARMQALFINTDFAPLVILSEAIEPMRQAFGATIAIRRTALEAIGGFRALKNLLADDFYLGALAVKRGYGVRLSTSVVTTACEEKTFSEFWNHQLRWARTYRTVRPASLATIAIHGPFWALCLLLASRFSLAAAGVFALVVGARVVMATVVMTRVLRLKQRLSDLWLVVLKDLAMTAIYFASLAGNTVLWGGRRFRVLKGGAMREVG